MISGIKFMGGVANIKDLVNIVRRSQCSLNITNCSSLKDKVLKKILPLAETEIASPVGFNGIEKVNGHEILNIDCTNFISGHFSYKANADIMGKLLNLSHD